MSTGNAHDAGPGSALLSFGVDYTDNPRVYYFDADNQVNELAWSWFGKDWHWRNLNADVVNADEENVPAAAPGSALTGFSLAYKNPRVYYLGGTDNHVHELAWNDEHKEWKIRDVNASAENTSAENAPAAIPGSALLSFGVDFADNPRVYYLSGADNHVHELAWSWFGKEWNWRNLNADAGNTVAAASGSPLTGFSHGGKNPRVYYLDANNQVQGLAWFDDQKVWKKDDIDVAAVALSGSALTSYELRRYTLSSMPFVTDFLDVDKVTGEEETTKVLSLEPAYPNPFNPTTTIQYNLPAAMHVRLAVYDVLGREVAVLVDNTNEAGTHEVSFDASRLSSGVYFYTLQTPEQTLTKRIMLAK